MNTAMNGPSWILGIPFLRAYAAKFDRANRKIALAAIPLGGEVCTSCASTATEVPSSSFAHSQSLHVLTQGPRHTTNIIRTLLPEQRDESELPKFASKRPRLSMRHLSLPTWVGAAMPGRGGPGS